MSQTTPPTVDPLPPAPNTSAPTVFSVLMDAFLAALISFQTQLVALGINVYNNAVDCFNNAVAAAASASTASSAAASATATANAVAWVSGQTYALYANAISPTDKQTYRKITSTAGGTVDPASNSTDWVRITAVAPGVGGTTITGSVTLTASSPAAMTVTPSAPGLYATLPVGTTCVKSTAPFSVYNAGEYDYGVKDSAGTQLGWIKPRTGAVIGLADNSTAAGVWAPYGLEKVGITASYTHPSLANLSNFLVRISIDANRTCFVFGGTDCYAIVYDASSQTWGSPTLVRATIGTSLFNAVLSASNQVMVVSCSSTTAFEAVTLSLSGTGITVNTANKATAVISGSLTSNGIGQFVAVGSSWVLGYSTSTPDSQIRALTVSTNTPVIGAAQTLNATAGAGQVAPQLFVSGSIVRTLVGSNTNLLACKPFTVSGSGLTGGTEVTATMTGSSAYRAFLNGNGNIVAHYLNTSHFASVFKLTGTVEAVSSITLGGSTPTQVLGNVADCIAVTSGKTLIIWFSGSSWYGNILTDTAGVASVGTAISNAFFSTVDSVQAIAVSGNNARVAVMKLTSGQLGQFAIDCSGSSPSISSVVSFGVSTNLTYLGLVTASNASNIRSAFSLIAGTTMRILGGAGSAFDLEIGSANIKYAPHNSLPTQATGTVGASSNESWIGGCANTTAGFALQRVELAA